MTKKKTTSEQEKDYSFFLGFLKVKVIPDFAFAKPSINPITHPKEGGKVIYQFILFFKWEGKTFERTLRIHVIEENDVVKVELYNPARICNYSKDKDIKKKEQDELHIEFEETYFRKGTNSGRLEFQREFFDDFEEFLESKKNTPWKK